MNRGVCDLALAATTQGLERRMGYKWNMEGKRLKHPTACKLLRSSNPSKYRHAYATTHSTAPHTETLVLACPGISLAALHRPSAGATQRRLRSTLTRPLALAPDPMSLFYAPSHRGNSAVSSIQHKEPSYSNSLLPSFTPTLTV
jgi:hypothetical protein